MESIDVDMITHLAVVMGNRIRNTLLYPKDAWNLASIAKESLDTIPESLGHQTTNSIVRRMITNE